MAHSFTRIACVTYFLCGIATVVLGTVLPEFLNHYHLSYTTGGELVFAQFTGFLIGAPIASYLLHYLKYKIILFISVLFIGLSLCGLTFTPYVFVVFVLYVLNGCGISSTETVVATYIMEFTGQQRVKVMTYLEIAFGFGALVIPAISSWFISQNLWNYSFIVTGVIATAIAFIWLIMDTAAVEKFPFKKGDTKKISIGTENNKKQFLGLLSLFLAMIFFYEGTESSLINFLPALFIRYLHVQAFISSLSISIFWIAMVIGRMATSLIIVRTTYGVFLSSSVIGTILTLLCLMITRNFLLYCVAVFLLGIFMSGIYSITMVFANHKIPGHAPLVTSLLTVFDGIGGALLPASVGYVMNRSNATSVLMLITVFAVIHLLILFAVLIMISRRINYCKFRLTTIIKSGRR